MIPMLVFFCYTFFLCPSGNNNLDVYDAIRKVGKMYCDIQHSLPNLNAIEVYEKVLKCFSEGLWKK